MVGTAVGSVVCFVDGSIVGIDVGLSIVDVGSAVGDKLGISVGVAEGIGVVGRISLNGLSHIVFIGSHDHESSANGHEST